MLSSIDITSAHIYFVIQQCQCNFHCIPVHSQYQAHLRLQVIFSALNRTVWLIETNLNTTDFQYSLLE